MNENNEKANVFVVDTIFQLLNAIEAANSLNMSNNHLVIINPEGQVSRSFRSLINEKDWVKVHYVSLIIDTERCKYRIFGPSAAESIRKWYGRYLHFRRMRRVANIIKKLKEVNNLFIGHYWLEYKYFMRHFANKLKHQTLYLLDDGTDTIDINNKRKLSNIPQCGASTTVGTDSERLLKKIENHFRKKYWNWNTAEAESVTFFTTYDINVRDGDHIIKNEYNYLRSLISRTTQIDEVYFLGDCLVDDKYMSEGQLIKYLQHAKTYFGNENIKYVPHPRESLKMIERVKEVVGFEIKKIDVPIEVELVLKGPIPKILASFCSSALESCSNIFGNRIRIVSFYLYPEHLLWQRDIIEGIYEYYKKKINSNFEIIRLDFDSMKVHAGE